VKYDRIGTFQTPSKIKGWRRGSKLPGRPDFVFPNQKIAIFIDGDFWHGNPKKYRLPKSNIEYWAVKLERNQKRDELISMTLKGMGWRVNRIWESALRDEEALAAKLKLLL
jgi:DNA mismatch endonuclease (patch repair protein)